MMDLYTEICELKEKRLDLLCLIEVNRDNPDLVSNYRKELIEVMEIITEINNS